jgi:hypothetical protein
MGLQLDTLNIFISYKWTIDQLLFAQRTIEFEARQSGRQAGIVPEALAQDRVEPGGRLWRAGLVVGFKTLNHVCCCKTSKDGTVYILHNENFVLVFIHVMKHFLIKTNTNTEK